MRTKTAPVLTLNGLHKEILNPRNCCRVFRFTDDTFEFAQSQPITGLYLLSQTRTDGINV